MTTKKIGACPFCMSLVKPTIIDKNTVRRDLCACPKCNKKILICRTPTCTSYAKAGTIYDDELCPTCDKKLAKEAGNFLKFGFKFITRTIKDSAANKKQ